MGEPALVDVDAIAPEPERTWPHVVNLKYPIEFGSERITRLELRRGRVGDTKGLKLSGEVPMDHLVTIASRLSGQPVRVIEMLDVEDAGEVMDAALDFFAMCLATGKKRSR